MNAFLSSSLGLAALLAVSAGAAPKNPFAVLDEPCDLYYPHAGYPKLTTPQWIGEPGVDAALVLAIDDMRDSKKYEEYLRPILERLKQIDGRAPVSIMTCTAEPQDPQLQTWLEEGVSLEAHTIDHPCPILDKGNFDAAKSTYDRCIDLLASIPGNRPVAFRTPCMDGINSASPRLFAEIMMRTAPSGRFLTLSSSIGVLLTPDDPGNPSELVRDQNGQTRFEKYLLPNYLNYIKDYPYPWVIGNLFWETGFAVPDDYQGSRVHGDQARQTVEDMKASIDAVVARKGIWVMTFHPYQWLANTQVIELIQHAAARHGPRVKFLTLREVQERLDQNLLAGQPLRRSDGGPNGVRLLDLNQDGYLDVVIGNSALRRTRVWDPRARRWNDGTFPADLTGPGARFGVPHRPGVPGLLVADETGAALWNFEGDSWIRSGHGIQGLELDGEKVLAARGGQDQGVRFRDLDGDGVSELIFSNPGQNAIFSWSPAREAWQRLGYSLPKGVSIVNAAGGDNGLRFVDFNKDGADDIILSNEKSFGLWLFMPADDLGFKKGFSREILRGQRGEQPEIPMIVRGGAHPNNGAWFSSETLWLQNEDTGKLPGLVQRVPFTDLLDGFQPGPKSPRDSLGAMETAPGFTVELAAHEPAVESPVWLDWSADGVLWVAEMRDYPLGIDGKSGGAVRRLQDEDGDGFYEKSTVFLSGLNFPNGLFPWRNGLLISAVPDILYAEDTDGDGQADRREVLFTGFAEGNQQHRANGFEWGLDGWIYGANGDSGGTVLSLKTGRRVPIGGRDFRFKPDTGEFEAVSGQTQHTRRRDDWGNWFGGANYSWGWHYVLEERYLARNPDLGVRTTYQPYATAGDAGRVFPISRPQQRFNDIGMAGHVTSACGYTPYRDTWFGPSFANTLFISEPVHNLVHREVLEADGVSFRSRRAPGEEAREFVASRDPWFRPTGLKTGPDGALYICDMYRLVIEHPEWIPADVKTRMNLRAGAGMGRIYRVVPQGKISRRIPNLAARTSEGLLNSLQSPNGWERDTAHRLLVERRAGNVIPALADLAASSPEAKTRLQSLAAIGTLGGVSSALLNRAFEDPHPALRVHALRLSEPFAAQDRPEPDLIQRVLDAARDSDPRVRFQAALTLGELGGKWAKPAAVRLADLAEHDSGLDPMVSAILSSSHRQPGLILSEVLTRGVRSSRLTAGLIKTAARAGETAGLSALAARFLEQSAAGPSPRTIQGLATLLNSGPDLRAQLLAHPAWSGAARHARDLVQNSQTDPEARAAAAHLLARTSDTVPEDLAALSGVLTPADPPVLRRAALARLEPLDHPAVPSSLLAAFPHAGLPERQSILAILLKRPAWALQLLDQIGEGSLRAADLGAAARQELLSHRSDVVRSRSASLLSSPAPAASRDLLVQSYVGELGRHPADAARGRIVFETHCAFCHKAGQLGGGAGPNLAMLSDRATAQIITAILDPNRAVEDRYRNYVAELKDGEEISGLLVAETGNSVTITGLNGAEQTILRRDLRALRAQDRSVMPEGFEQFLSPGDMADLVAFMRGVAPQ